MGETWPVYQDTPQPLYYSIVGVQANFLVSYPNRVITRVKCIVIQEDESLITIWGPALICVVTKTVL